MHKTIYIDVDEEITSIIERMRNARSDEVVISVPKRALLIQNILNLKILKKEAERMRVSVAVVTQDKLGRLLAEKAGIDLAQNIEEGYQEISEKSLPSYESAAEDNTLKGSLHQKESIQDRIESIGSESYYEEGAPRGPSISDRLDRWPAKDTSREKITNQELVGGIDSGKKDPAEKKMFIGIDSTVPVASSQSASVDSLPSSKTDVRNYSMPEETDREFQHKKRDEQNEKIEEAVHADKKVEDFFKHVDEEKAGADVSHESKKSRKLFPLFLCLILAVVILAGAYLAVPKAKVTLYVQPSSAKTIEDEIQVDANFSEIDFEEGTIPGKNITVTSEVTNNFQTSGSKSVSNQKSHGTITIYNEFGTDPQPLVATTRFESEDGKVFRIKKGITVPGMTKVGDEIKPGVIEAEVEADKSGAEYDIGPSKFSIPGFQSNKTKYEKIYGKSTKAMTAGNSSASDSKVLTQEDIDLAKNKAVLEVKEAAKNKIKQETGAGMILLDDAISFKEANFSTSNSIGDVIENFELRVEIKASAIIFSEADMKNIIAKVIAKSGDLKVSIDGSSVLLEYKSVNPDIDMGKLIVKVSASNKQNLYDTEKIRKEILGKNEQSLKEYIEKNYPDIVRAEVNYWPPFLKQGIPIWEKRVEVEIQNEVK